MTETIYAIERAHHRPYDATLSNPKSKKPIVAARRLELLGCYAGLWKVSFDRQSVKGPVLNGAEEVVFEARLSQNLDFKASFKMDKLAPMLARHIWRGQRRDGSSHGSRGLSDVGLLSDHPRASVKSASSAV
jgi:hypothetical protein